jgi:hypothetical protein
MAVSLRSENIFIPHWVPFTSLCPKCRREQPQSRLRIALLKSFGRGDSIEAYCAACDETWSISDRERNGIAKRV